MKSYLATWSFQLGLLSSWSSGSAALPTQDVAALAGQHVIYSYSGLTPAEHLFDLTKDGKVGGIILFKENIGNETAEIIARLQSTYKQSPYYLGVPLLITTDQEGGKVRRVPGGPFLSAKQIGNSTSPIPAAIQAGKEAHEALLPYNVNSNLAPVLDIYREPGNFIDEFQRSYGNTSRIVSECASAFLVTQQHFGIATTAKHFPGLGAAPAGSNTDLEPVTIDLSLQEIRKVDQIPYIAAIATGIKMVMASWAIYPTLDAKFPAGLSHDWVQGELRNRLHFKGVTVTDALEAGSLAAFGDVGTLSVLATQAGMDLLLASQRNVTQGEAATSALVDALNDGSLSREDFESATKRIISMRKSLA